jgi:hypothetical protein
MEEVPVGVTGGVTGGVIDGVTGAYETDEADGVVGVVDEN